MLLGLLGGLVLICAVVVGSQVGDRNRTYVNPTERQDLNEKEKSLE